MKKYVCSVCGYIYDEADGIPGAGIAPGTLWAQLPDDWVCPICKAGKSAFREQGGTASPAAETMEKPEFQKEYSDMELSVICSNLARGCEKQYLAKEAEDFWILSEKFHTRADAPEKADFQEILRQTDEELEKLFPYASNAAKQEQDRGALRSLVWSEKVTRMTQSLLQRYEAEGDAMLDGADVYVCSVCGFIYIGNDLPDVCPVCKVPSWKFVKMEGRAG